MHMTITYTRQGDVHTLETGGAALPRIVIDNSNIAEDQRGGTAKQLLGCSALFCYMSAFVGALNARDVNFSDVQASAELEVGANELGQGRVKKIVVNASVAIDEDDSPMFQRVEKLMRNGCLITGSLHDGIEMEYHIHARYRNQTDSED